MRCAGIGRTSWLQSLAMPAAPALDAAARAARALAGRPVASIERVRGYGRNSGVYRVNTGGAAYALKQYPARQPKYRDRATGEYPALRFLPGHGIAPVPRPTSGGAPNGYRRLEVSEGDPIDAPKATNTPAALRLLSA